MPATMTLPPFLYTISLLPDLFQRLKGRNSPHEFEQYPSWQQQFHLVMGVTHQSASGYAPSLVMNNHVLRCNNDVQSSLVGRFCSSFTFKVLILGASRRWRPVIQSLHPYVRKADHTWQVRSTIFTSFTVCRRWDFTAALPYAGLLETSGKLGNGQRWQ